MWSENDGTLLTCQPTTRFHAHRFTKVKSRTSSRVLVLNVGLLPTLQKFRSALAQYANRSSPRGFISEDPHIVWCAFASVPTIVGIYSFSVKTNKSLSNCNYILFTKLPWPGDSEGTFRSSSQAATCPSVYHTRWRLHTVPLIAERQAGKL